MTTTSWAGRKLSTSLRNNTVFPRDVRQATERDGREGQMETYRKRDTERQLRDAKEQGV